jgi:RimJ/RimL family protein N-acetyltransferase
VSQSESAFLGTIGFADPEGWPGFELAWTLARHWWGHGYATEGARAALAYAFDVLRKEHVISLIDPDNHRSIRVAERIGETLGGRVDHFGKEMLCYGIAQESWAARWPVIGGATLKLMFGVTVRALDPGSHVA